jgi:isopentenyl-diphosphate delta-isomerase
MKNSKTDKTSKRKKEHIELCLSDKVSFKEKTNGFDYYDFKHYAITEVVPEEINFQTKFLGKKINFPFLISCMTGGTVKAESINAKLALAAEQLKIPVGVGSQRQALENDNLISTYKIIRKNAPTVPLLANIGAAQAIQQKNNLRKLVDMVEADAIVIHINPLQELLQPEGEPNFKGLLKSIEKVVKIIGVPVIAKEVGSGISAEAAKKLLESGVKGIDVAGAGGTSWAGVEILRRKENSKNVFWDWGLPTSFCIKEIFKLKKKYKFALIGSGGINSGIDAAKAFALGSDLVASARIILQELDKKDVNGVVELIQNWFSTVRNVMFLTGSSTLKEFKKNKIIRKDFLY